MAEATTLQTAKIAELKRRIAADPASRSFLELAREYHEAGLFEEAGVVCEQGLKYHPHYVSARVLLGRVCFDSGRTEEARGHMEAVVAVVPDNLVARRVLAEICRIQGDMAGALERYRALLAFNTGDEETKSRIREIEASLEEGQAPAPPAAKAAVESEPLATPTLAEIYLEQGLTQKAIEVYREVLKGDTGNQEAARRLAELEGGKREDSPDPARLLVTRKVEALSGWLEAIRRGARA